MICSGGSWHPTIVEQTQFWLQEVVEEEAGLCVAIHLRDDIATQTESTKAAKTVPHDSLSFNSSPARKNNPRRMIGLIGIRTAGFVFYYLHPDYWGEGYCTEALKSYLDALFRLTPGLQAVKANVRSLNPASQRVLEKCGFSRSPSSNDSPADTQDSKGRESTGNGKRNDFVTALDGSQRERYLPQSVEDELRQSLMLLGELHSTSKTKTARDPLIQYEHARIAS
jgi:RimJ/RimL family protein N-acetyltransferase